jgi:NitT/TauT family transport system ATP-binding protein
MEAKMTNQITKKLGLHLQSVRKVYEESNGKVTVAVEDVSLEVPAGGFVSILGPSGCGKTTILKMCAGLISPTSGEIWLDGHQVKGPDRERGLVFQAFTLFPWLTVQQNVRFGCKYLKLSPKEVKKRVKELLNLVGLTDSSEFYPSMLSGGMQQRAAIARTLAADPDVLLMDEPFGSLDTQTRALMQEFLLDIWSKTSKTVLFVTHDVEEAVFLSDTVGISSARPARIKHIEKITLTRPRSFKMKSTPEFIKIRSKIAELVRSEAIKSMK